MKKIIIISILILSGCEKKNKPDELVKCTFGLDSTLLQANVNNTGKRPRKTDATPVVTTTPTGTSKGVILLDFDGHYFDKTHWNWNGPVTVESANLDSTSMIEVFNKVSRAYSKWQVTVTTSESIFNAAPIGSRIRCVITSSHEWYGLSGGASFVGSFQYTDNTPNFVFTAALGYNIKYIKEAVCHEVGHSLGLYHQSDWSGSTMINAYRFCYCPSDNGCCDMAPIMGNSYYKDSTLFITGKNQNGEIQNDTAMISKILKRK